MPPHLSVARRAGDFLFLSGQLALDARGQLLDGGVREQTARCLANLDMALASHGLGRKHVVKTMVWLRDPKDFEDFNAAYSEFFGEHRPARSTACAQLALPAARVEIEAIAHFD